MGELPRCSRAVRCHWAWVGGRGEDVQTSKDAQNPSYWRRLHFIAPLSVVGYPH